MSQNLLTCLIPGGMVCSLGGLFYVLSLLSRGQKKKGSYIALISLGILNLLFAFLMIIDHYR